MNRRLLLLVACVLVTVPLGAQTTAEPAGEVPISFYVTGTRSVEGASNDVHLEIVSGSAMAIRFFSEPSHTLVAAFASTRDGDPRESGWWKTIFPNQVAVALVPLEIGTKVTQRAAVAPATDKSINILMYAVWPGGTAVRDGVIRVATNPNDFRFTFQQFSTDGVICCNRTPEQCGGACIRCSGGEYRCCAWHTNSGCGWCNEIRAECTADPCPEC